MQVQMVLAFVKPATGVLQKAVESVKLDVMNHKWTTKCREDMAKIARADNTDRLLRQHVDQGGFALAPLAESTLRNKSRGSGPPLVPQGALSRFIKNFRADWVMRGGMWVLIIRYLPILSKKGKNIVPFHLNGTKHLPKRDVLGTSPRAISAMERRGEQFEADMIWLTHELLKIKREFLLEQMAKSVQKK